MRFLGAWALRRAPGWILLIVVSGLAAAPVLVAVWSLAEPSTDVWRQLWDTRLPGMISDTIILVVTVVAGTVALGTGLAWVVTAHDFPGRRLLGWLLVTPLAVPGYVLGFVWLDTLQGPLGARAVRSIWLCALVLVLTLYPYVYLFARAAMREQSQRPVDVARSLGCTPWQAWWRVVVPMARPSIAAGAALVAMEVLTDVGTVRLFNVSTVADGVLRVWFDTGDREAASELAVLLIVAAVGLIALERGLRGRARYTQSSAGGGLARRPRSTAVLPMAVAGWAVLAVAVIVPVAQLSRWAMEARRLGQTATVAGDAWFHLGSSLKVAGLATAVCLIVGVLMVFTSRRRGHFGKFLSRVATLGYDHYGCVGPLRNDQGAPMYHLQFFSKSPKGLAIWKGIGQISNAPDFEVTYSSGSLPLVFRTQANSDTTLIVNGPDGLWYCDDDSGEGLNAQVTFTKPQSGTYDIWVGTYSGGTSGSQLLITELP